MFNEWGEVDRSHRKLAHRGSWLGRFWADPSTVRRVLERRDLRFRAPKREGRTARRPWPDWAEEVPNRIWIYDTTHWTKPGAATTVISDVISRKWIADITSADETSTEVQAVFNRALPVEGLDDVIDERNPDGIAWDPDSDEVPVLLVMSDNGPQDEFRVDEGVYGASTCSAPNSTSAVSTTTRSGSTPASATSPPTKNTKAKEQPFELPAETASPEPDNTESNTIATTKPEDPTMRAETSGTSDIKSDTPHIG